MSSAAERVAAMLAALEKLPGTRGVVFRGLPAGVEPPQATLVTRLLTATTRDPRVATNNFAHPAVAAIVSRSGRDVSQLSTDPGLAEVILLPGSTLVPIQRLDLTQPQITVFILEQVDPGTIGPPDIAGLPPTLEALLDTVGARLTRAAAFGPIGSTDHARFAGPIE